jgi:hypothetical protein
VKQSITQAAVLGQDYSKIFPTDDKAIEISMTSSSLS